MNKPFFFLALLCHLLPQDGNAGYMGPPSCSSSKCHDTCILKGYTGGLCLVGICKCLIYKRVVGRAQDLINRNEMKLSPSYFPTNYFDPYQGIRGASMLEFPHPHSPPPIFGGSGGIDLPPVNDVDGMPPDFFKHPLLMSSYPSLPVDVMSGDSVVIKAKPGEIKKETEESIGLFIGGETVGRKIEINAGSNSTESLPPDGKEKQPDLKVVKKKQQSADDKGDFRKIHTDSSGKFVEDKMTVGRRNEDTNSSTEVDLGVKMLPDAKTRRKRDANNAKRMPNENLDAVFGTKPNANNTERTTSEKLNANVEGEKKTAFLTSKTMAEDGKKTVAQDKQSFQEDKKQGTMADDKKIVEQDKQSVKEDKKQGTVDNKDQKKPKKKRDPDALSERKVTKALGQLETMLTNMSKDPFAATKDFFSGDKNLFSDSIFG